MKNKVTVIGAGHVGATCAQYLAIGNLADVVLVDLIEGLPQGKALDITEAGWPLGFDARVTGANDYSATADSDVIVMTAGLARKPGMSREDLLFKNAEIVQSCVQQAVKHSPNAILIVVTNPIDVMTYHAYRLSNFPVHRVMGQAGVLDSARFAAFISMELGCSVRDVSAMVLGGHGDSMVPLPRYATVNGIAVTELIPGNRLEEIVQRARDGGGEIVALLKTGSAYHAPAAATAVMVESVLRDQKRVLPCSVFLSGQYGMDDIYVGCPARLGAGGVEEIVELQLTREELEAFQKSAEGCRKNVRLLGY